MVGNQEDRGVTAEEAAALAPFGLSPSGSSAKLPAANAVATLRRMIECEEAQGDDGCIEWIDAWEMAIEAITKAASA